MTAFADWPIEKRFEVRNIIEEEGGMPTTYTGDGLNVAMPNTMRKWVIRCRLEALGLKDTDWAFFPLVTDTPPDVLRHDGHYPGSKGFWLYVHFIPA